MRCQWQIVELMSKSLLLPKIIIWNNPQLFILDYAQTSERCQLLIVETVIIA